MNTEYADRYSRQRQLSWIGSEGMAKIRQAHICIVGIGALGCQLAELCCRAGVGRLTLIDRDYVELSNLQRQCLFTEAHAIEGLPKALAASQVLQTFNSEVELQVIVAELNVDFVRYQSQVFESISLLLDGSDNFACRFLLNEIAIARQIPYIYGAAVATGGTVMPIIPGLTACLRCLLPSAPATEATCATHGVLSSSILQTAAAQFTLALQVITDQVQDCPSQMQCFDLWMQQHAVLDIPIRLDCPTCQQRLFPLLEGKNGPRSQWLCGRTAIQLSHSSLDAASLRLIAQRFAPQVQRMSLYHLELDWMLSQQSHRLTLFQDGRLIVNNCHDEKQAQLILQSVLGGIANDLS